MKIELIAIINELKEVLLETGLEVSDADILENARSLFISSRIELGKNKRVETINQKEEKEESASDKQMTYLEKLGYKGKKELTKNEARVLIKEILTSQKQEDY